MSVNNDSEGKPLLEAGSREDAGLLADSAPYGLVARRANIPMSFFNLSQNVLGAGAFSIPSAIAATGLGGGIFMLLIIACIGIFTLLVLTYFTNTLQQQTYQGIITHTLGKRVAFAAQLLVLFYTFGSAVIYLQMIRDNLTVPLQHFLGVHPYTDRRLLITLYTICIPGPLSYLRNMVIEKRRCFEKNFFFLNVCSKASLSYGSTFGVLFVLYAVVFVTADGISFLTSQVAAGLPVPDYIHGFNPSITFAQSFPNIVFAFMTHVGFVPIAAELMNPTMARTGVVVSLSFVMCAFLYFAIGIVGYLRIGTDCFTNINGTACTSMFPRFGNLTVREEGKKTFLMQLMCLCFKGSPPDLTNILNFYPATDVLEPLVSLT
jgi:amino acid permease